MSFMIASKVVAIPLGYPNLNFPASQYLCRQQETGGQIYDIVRKKMVKLSAEEWVRQNLLHYLVFSKKYPLALIGIEKLLRLNGAKRRYDIVCYNNAGLPVLLCECKAPQIKLNQDTIEQAGSYNTLLKAPIIFTTNGHQHLCVSFNITSGAFEFLQDIPDYK